MATKYVSDTNAGKSVSAYVILKRHHHVATIRAHFSDGGVCLVNVFNHGRSKSAEKLPFQSGKASGYGYDKFTAALSGLEIDGHKLSNHCEFSKPLPPSGVWPRDAVAPRGWHFANWKTSEWKDDKRVDVPAERQGYASCYRHAGLDYLKALGYSVIQAI